MPKDRIYQLSMSVGRGASASWEMSILRALYASGAKPMSVMAKAMSGIQIEKKGGASADACKADVIKTDCPQKKIRKRIRKELDDKYHGVKKVINSIQIQ